ncbi:hypothetical protein [Thalassobacillus sp. CUG 92003]|uniref:fluoroquinolone export ABC transporter permease subunit n=1 Tax=Thalassobacillus sp. CUG 92003 TaxID=2736641 RepID=UPI0015E6C2E4|nr:hypothetical protein [Thalassobacillus sp. CUG 92003]
MMTLLKQDIRFQWRHGFYLVYVIVTLFYLMVLGFVPDTWKLETATAIIFTDPTMLGFFFIGAMVLFEKDQGIFRPLSAAPVRRSFYVLSKVMSLLSLSLSSSLVIHIGSIGVPEHPALFILGVVLSSIFFTLAGFALCIHLTSINQYLMFGAIVITSLYVPLLELIPGFSHIIWYLFPARAGLSLLYPLAGDPAWWGMATVLFLWIWLFFFIAHLSLKRVLRG